MDLVRVWVATSDPDVLVLSETWLKKSVSDSFIHITGYHLFHSDRPSKGSGVSIYIKTRFNCRIAKSFSRPKIFEFLSIDISLSSTLLLTVIGCYKPPSASKEAFNSLADV